MDICLRGFKKTEIFLSIGSDAVSSLDSRVRLVSGKFIAQREKYVSIPS